MQNQTEPPYVFHDKPTAEPGQLASTLLNLFNASVERHLEQKATEKLQRERAAAERLQAETRNFIELVRKVFGTNIDEETLRGFLTLGTRNNWHHDEEICPQLQIGNFTIKSMSGNIDVYGPWCPTCNAEVRISEVGTLDSIGQTIAWLQENSCARCRELKAQSVEHYYPTPAPIETPPPPSLETRLTDVLREFVAAYGGNA